jgi:hypothetical protein
MVPHKLSRFHVTEFAVGAVESSIKIRSSPEAHASGYDIVISAGEPQVRLLKTGKDSDGAGPFDPEPSDVLNVLRFRNALEEACRSLATKRRALTSAEIDEQAMEESEHMRTLVERLVQVLAPVVREISAHSLSPDELVLRRMTGDDRREEIFVSKSELRAILDGLGDDDRRLFDPLELDAARMGVRGATANRVSESAAEHEIVPLGASRTRANGSTRPPPSDDLVAHPRD